ncbi:restriction endonuclease subunit S [Arcobacter vandammei]|uniref:restriction endonuclease subunit S n=1 Tax=Arcobacter vandammei TaxID=2782243 RepID=UPI00211D842E
MSEDSYNDLSEKAKAKKGDIFLTKTGTVGLSAYVNEDFPIAITQNIAVIRVPNEKYSHQFILQTFKTQSFYRTAISKVNQSTIMDLQLQDIRKLLVSFPSKQEQEKIASFLTSVDEKIEKLSKKDELLQQYKKSIMQKIFNQEIRFRDDNGDEFSKWENKRLEDVLSTVSTKLYQIKSTDILEKGTYKVIDQGQNKVAGYCNDDNKVYRNGEIIVYGDHTTIVKYIDFDFIVGADGTKLLTTIKSNNLKYMYYNLLYNNIQAEGYKRHFSILRTVILQIPCIEEQNKIANFLSNIDDKIEENQKVLEKAKEFKKSLFQQMFV